MKKLLILMIVITTCSLLMAGSADSRILAGPFKAGVELSLDEDSYYYEIGFTRSETQPDAYVVYDTYHLILGDDGRGHDDGKLYIWWEITGRDFSISLDWSELEAAGHESLLLDITWNGKDQSSREVFSAEGLYSGKKTVPLEIVTAPVTDADAAQYTGTLTLTIRRI